MVQKPAKNVTCSFGKSASHAVAVDGTLDMALLEVQAASSQVLIRQTLSPLLGIRPQAKTSEVSWRLSMFWSDIGKDPIEYN